jgi:hypothetical protein
VVGFNFWIGQEKGVLAYMNSHCNVYPILEDFPIYGTGDVAWPYQVKGIPVGVSAIGQV